MIRFKILQAGVAKVNRPGSSAARVLGCGCPVAANRAGRGWEVSDDATCSGFWIEDGCTIHGPLLQG